jgi:tetrahydromethanopterin S-methyltransferase subunit G
MSIETRVSRNTHDIEALYGLIEEFAGRTRANFANVNHRFDDLEGKFNNLENKVDNLEGKFDNIENKVNGIEGKVDNIAGQLGAVLELLRKQSH